MTDREREKGQLSESADSRTERGETPKPADEPQHEEAQPEAPGKHGRPTDDSDPGHS